MPGLKYATPSSPERDLGLERRDGDREGLDGAERVLKVHRERVAALDAPELKHDAFVVGAFAQLEVLHGGLRHSALQIRQNKTFSVKK